MNPTRPNLLILTSSFPRGPRDETCGYIRDFARSLSTEFNVQVLAPPDSRAEDWPAESFTLMRSRSLLGSLDPFQGSRDLNTLSKRNPLSILALILSLSTYFLKALALARKADVICSHWMVPCGFMGSMLGRVLQKPHVVVEHSGALHRLSRIRGGRWLARVIVGGAQRVVVVSSDLRHKLAALTLDAGDKVEVLSMGTGIETTALPAREEDHARTVVFVGRLAEIKGIDVLLRASEGESWRLLIAGEGERRRHLEELAGALKVDACFLGEVDGQEREQLLSLADVVVIPSIVLTEGRTEGMPVACLEALAAGRPVIASRVGGLPEIICDGENGLLVEPGDPNMLREKLTLVLNDQSLQQRLAENARQSALRFDWADTGIRFAEIIKESLRKNDQDIDARRLRARNAKG